MRALRWIGRLLRRWQVRRESRYVPHTPDEGHNPPPVERIALPPTPPPPPPQSRRETIIVGGKPQVVIVTPSGKVYHVSSFPDSVFEVTREERRKDRERRESEEQGDNADAD